MSTSLTDAERADLDAFVQAFERAYQADSRVDLAGFLPPPEHRLHLPILCELIRIDLEYGWERGNPVDLATYLERFPELASDRRALREVAFEEYRLSRMAGHDSTPGGLERFGVRGDDGSRAGPDWADLVVSEDGRWSTRGTPGTDGVPIAGGPWAALPEVGESFLGFRLIEQLGKGSFGRVYLARQDDLANRLVALKVSSRLLGESRTLARLQHTNIVPIYSAHRVGPLQAVCMPYFGSTTLRDVLEDLANRADPPGSGRDLLSFLESSRESSSSTTSLGGTSPPSVPGVESEASVAEEATEMTLASSEAVRRVEGLSYVEAILWVGARLADGLAHAHERGVVHRDLKPANILLADDGQPMLLDFNLSDDAGDTRHPAVGGTLAYMAPEQLEALRGDGVSVDARSDVYALGIVLYELLTLARPFETRGGSASQVIKAMIAERQERIPSPRRRNPAVSPAVESIMARLLEPEPDRRYQSARELQEDLERQLAHLHLRHAREPSVVERLRKWARRHPRITSSASVIGLATSALMALTLAFILRGERLARLEVRGRLARFESEARDAQYFMTLRAEDRRHERAAVDSSRRALSRFGALDDPAWWRSASVGRLPDAERARLREGAGDLFLLLARADVLDGFDRAETGADRERLQATYSSALAWSLRAEQAYPEGKVPRALWIQRADVAHLRGDLEEANHLLEQAERTPLRGARDGYLLALEAIDMGRYREARSLLNDAVSVDPSDFGAWSALAYCHRRLGSLGEAAACYRTCVALRPTHAGSWFDRGEMNLRRGEAGAAAADFERALRLRPGWTEALVNLSLARMAVGDYRAAEGTLTEVLERGAPPTRLLYLRAEVRSALGDAEGAARDRQEADRSEPSDEAGLLARGFARQEIHPLAALDDYKSALAINPRSFEALKNSAYLLAERLDRTEDAVRMLDRVVEFYPDDIAARSSRGVLLARLGRRGPALADATAALRSGGDAEIVYQVAGIYALTSREVTSDVDEAMSLLAMALAGGTGLDLIDDDPDLAPIRGLPRFRRLVDAARTLIPTEGPARGDVEPEELPGENSSAHHSPSVR